MKSIWIKYLFALAVVGLSVGLYQVSIHKNSTFAPVSDFEQLQDQQIGNFGFSELNRAARIAQQEQEFQDADLDIPVVFEQYDQPIGYVPEKSSKSSALRYDPNAGLAIDRSSNAASAQLPIESYPSYPELSLPYPDAYHPSSDFGPSDSSSAGDQKSKTALKSSGETPTFSKIEYPKENQDVEQKIKSIPSRTKISDSIKKPMAYSKTKTEPDQSQAKDQQNAKLDDEQKNTETLDDISDVVDEDESGPLKNFMKKLWNWWKGHQPEVEQEIVLPKAEVLNVLDPLLEVTPREKYIEDEGLAVIPSEKVTEPEVLFHPVQYPSSEPVQPAVVDAAKKNVSYDQSVRPVDLQKSLGQPASSQQNMEKKIEQPRNELAKLENTISKNKPRVPGSTGGLRPTPLKLKQRTPDEEFARDMELLKLEQAAEFNAIPYEFKSESDPFGQLYLVKNKATGEEFIGVQEEIHEYLQNLPVLQKIQNKLSDLKKYIQERHKINQTQPTQDFERSSSDDYLSSDRMTDEQRVEQAIEQLFEGPSRPQVEDVTKEIMPSSSTGPVTLAESASRIAASTATEVAAIAEGGSAAARIAAK